MNINTLIVQFLIVFAVVIVKSNQKDLDVIKPYIVREGKLFRPERSLNTKSKVAFSAWKPGNLMLPGTYSLYLVSPGYFKLKLGEFNFRANKDWVNIPNTKWVDIPRDDVSEFRLRIKHKHPPSYRNIFGFIFGIPNTPENWLIKINVKQKYSVPF